MFKLVLEKAEEPEIKLPTCWIIKKAKEFQESIYFCFIDYAKAFVWITINVEILKEMGLRLGNKHWNGRKCQRMLKLPHNCTHLTR